MISTDLIFETEEQRIQLNKTMGFKFVPEGTGPKVYCVVCANGSDWNEIHNYIINENEIDNIPNRKIECINLKKTCDKIGSYEISDAEAEKLRNHPKIVEVSIDEGYYQGTYRGKDIFPNSQPVSKTSRYSGNVKIGRDMFQSGMYSGSDSTWLKKTGAQIYRHQSLNDPWRNSNDDTLLQDNPEQYGNGTDVDIIVNDTSSWFGHIEFVKTGVGEPTNFTGTNPLKSGFASYSTTGVCGVLDVILHAPYWIDPDFFEANGAPSNSNSRLRIRWDGTTVPKEQAARDWWCNESTTYRSAKYVSSNITGGTATPGSNEDFGEIQVPNGQTGYSASYVYTEAGQNGSNTALHTGVYNRDTGSLGDHGTPCMSQAFGKTHGWAYNANKWFISIIWDYGAVGLAELYEVLKVFHDLKPNRSSDNTKNPTITSNSWGGQTRIYNNWYSYWRTAGDGTGGQQISMDTSANISNLSWLSNLRTKRSQQTIGGITYAASVEHSSWLRSTHPTMVEAGSMVDSGVIWMASAGNNNNQLVKGDHANYNNYVINSSSGTLASAEQDSRMVNRPPNPACAGMVPNYNNGGVDVYRSLIVGALDENTNQNGDGTYQEQKASYSNMGNAVDFYTIGDGSIAAKGGPTASVTWARNDSTYRIDSNYNIVQSGGTLSLTSSDKYFDGTSSACPVGAGLIATKFQFNRTWLWSDIKNWLDTRVTVQSSTSEFLEGTEATSANDSNWNSLRNLQGSLKRILWDAVTSDVVAPTLTSSVPSNGATQFPVGDNIVLNFSEIVTAVSGKYFTIYTSGGSLVEQIDVTDSKVSGSGTAQITINPANDLSPNTSYYILISAGAFKDSANNDYAGITNSSDFTFQTNAGGSNPTLLSTIPAKDATGVAINTNIILNFSENVNAQSGNITIHFSIGFPAQTISVTSNQVSGSGTAQITVNPASDLAANSGYYVTIDPTAFDDDDGNSFAGVSDSTTIKFVTGGSDTTAPTLVSTNPPAGATGVAVFSDVEFNFSEAVYAQSGNFVIYKASDNSVVETISVTSGQVTGSGTSLIRLNPTALAANTTFYIHIDSTAFDDAAGNSFAGISDSTTVRFTTGADSGDYSLRFFGNGLTFNGQLIINP